jgi:hypothetical protein
MPSIAGFHARQEDTKSKDPNVQLAHMKQRGSDLGDQTFGEGDISLLSSGNVPKH